MLSADLTRLGPRFVAALEFALEVHGADVRKGDQPIAYASHLLAVAGLVIEDGGTEVEAIAGLLHDTAEDHGGEAMLEQIAQHPSLGEEVARIVRGCSDSLLPEGDAKRDWRQRKQDYLDHLEHTRDASVLRVSNADKLHNARAMLADYRRMGDALYARFTSQSGDDQLWYYRRLAHLFYNRRQGALPKELRATVRAWEVLVESGREAGRAAWLGAAIVDTDQFIHTCLDGFEEERTWARFASEDYDWVLFERDSGERAKGTLEQLKGERDAYLRALRHHRQKWSVQDP